MSSLSGEELRAEKLREYNSCRQQIPNLPPPEEMAYVAFAVQMKSDEKENIEGVARQTINELEEKHGDLLYWELTYGLMRKAANGIIAYNMARRLVKENSVCFLGALMLYRDGQNTGTVLDANSDMTHLVDGDMLFCRMTKMMVYAQS